MINLPNMPDFGPKNLRIYFKYFFTIESKQILTQTYFKLKFYEFLLIRVSGRHIPSSRAHNVSGSLQAS